MKLYVGNLSFKTTEQALEELFTAVGTVTDTHLVMDRMTQRPRGFGFVTMSTPKKARRRSKNSMARLLTAARFRSAKLVRKKIVLLAVISAVAAAAVVDSAIAITVAVAGKRRRIRASSLGSLTCCRSGRHV